MSRVEDVLAAHEIEVEHRAYPAYACSCGEWDGAKDDDGSASDGQHDNAEAARAHVAAALAAAGIGDTAAAEARGAHAVLDAMEAACDGYELPQPAGWMLRAAREAARNTGAQATGLQVDLRPGGARQVHRPAPLTPPAETGDPS